MAEVTLNPIISSISGRLGGIVFFTSRGRQYARSYVSPANPDTDAQRKRRSLFGAAVKSWQALQDAERENLDRMAGACGRSGYHLYISRYMKAKPAAEGLPHKAKSFRPSHKAFSIGIDPVPLRFTFPIAPQQAWRIMVIVPILFQPLLL